VVVAEVVTVKVMVLVVEAVSVDVAV